MASAASTSRSNTAIEVVDLVWKGLRQSRLYSCCLWVGIIEVVDLVWKGLRHQLSVEVGLSAWGIEVVDLVWKGLRLRSPVMDGLMYTVLKSLTWFGRDCDI